MALSLCRRLPSRIPIRTFSTTASRPISLELDKNDQDFVKDVVPAYPYGPARWYKQSNLGLYGGQRIHFGNNVGPKSKTKTRRSWKPNVQNRRLWSKALHRYVQLRITMRTLRTVELAGGLDEYLLGDTEARLRELGETGWWLRWAIMQTKTVKKRFEEERATLGVTALQEEITQQREMDRQRRRPDVGAPLEEAKAAGLEEAVPVRDEKIINDTSIDGRPGSEETSKSSVTSTSPASASSFKRSDDKAMGSGLRFRVNRRRHVVLTAAGWKPVSRPEAFQAWAIARGTEQLAPRLAAGLLAPYMQRMEKLLAERKYLENKADSRSKMKIRSSQVQEELVKSSAATMDGASSSAASFTHGRPMSSGSLAHYIENYEQRSPSQLENGEHQTPSKRPRGLKGAELLRRGLSPTTTNQILDNMKMAFANRVRLMARTEATRRVRFILRRKKQLWITEWKRSTWKETREQRRLIREQRRMGTRPFRPEFFKAVPALRRELAKRLGIKQFVKALL